MLLVKSLRAGNASRYHSLATLFFKDTHPTSANLYSQCCPPQTLSITKDRKLFPSYLCFQRLSSSNSGSKHEAHDAYNETQTQQEKAMVDTILSAKAPHFHDKTYGTDDLKPIGHNQVQGHPIWSSKQLEDVRINHRPPERFVDYLALLAVRTLRIGFDITSGYAFGRLTETKWIRRIVFLETVAGVPGMMGAMVRHLKSLRSLQKDHGWIHTLLDEAENERMHLMVALHLHQPGSIFRLGTMITQGVFTNFFFIAYLCSSRFCHRFVGYLEEEAVITYSKLLEDIDHGCLTHWKTETAPEMAIKYWSLPKDATKRDMILAIRADEAHHRLVNHALASIKSGDKNPFLEKDS